MCFPLSFSLWQLILIISEHCVQEDISPVYFQKEQVKGLLSVLNVHFYRFKAQLNGTEIHIKVIENVSVRRCGEGKYLKSCQIEALL